MTATGGTMPSDLNVIHASQLAIVRETTGRKRDRIFCYMGVIEAMNLNV